MRLTFFALVSLILSASAAHAADLTVISGGAIRTGLIPATSAFEQKTDYKIELVFNSTPQIRKRLAAGDRFDVVVAPPKAMADFLKTGAVVSDGLRIGRVGAGIVARRNAPTPKIATKDQLKAALLDADGIVFNRSSSGLYIESLIKEMGVWPQIEAKIVRHPRSDAVMEHVLNSRGKVLGFGPMTRILAYKNKGLALVAPLPPEVQKLRAYNAAPMSASKRKNLAEKYIAFLVGADGKPFFVSAGIE